MREKIIRRLIVTVVVVAIAALMFTLKRPPLGIDLAGGALGVCLIVALHRAAGVGAPTSEAPRG